MKICRNTILPLCLLSLIIQTALAQIDPSRINIARDRWGIPHIFAKTDA